MRRPFVDSRNQMKKIKSKGIVIINDEGYESIGSIAESINDTRPFYLIQNYLITKLFGLHLLTN